MNSWAGPFLETLFKKWPALEMIFEPHLNNELPVRKGMNGMAVEGQVEWIQVGPCQKGGGSSTSSWSFCLQVSFSAYSLFRCKHLRCKQEASAVSKEATTVRKPASV